MTWRRPDARQRPFVLVCVLLAVGVAAGIALAFRSAPPANPFGSGAAAPKTRYVSRAVGSDRAPGTPSRPWKTIRRALRSLRPGDVVVVGPGTYPETLVESRSGRANAPIAIAALPGERPTITGRLKISGSWVRVSGFLFRGQTSANRHGVLVYVAGADHVELSGNELEDAAKSGVYLGDPGKGADYARIVGNYIHDNGTHSNLDHGVYYGTGRGGYIANNVVVDNYAKGIQLYPDCDQAVVANNTIVRNRRYGIILGGDDGTTSSGNVIANNVVAFNGSGGITTYWGSGPGTGNVATDNLVFQNGSATGNTNVFGDSLAASGTIVVDPLFRKDDDFRLGPGSPALDAAQPRWSPPTDIAGRARPEGAGPDLGAYESG
ncbi:MAG: hypothetical protein QOE36_309 [Gaiellaceae bacterium]|nr:hypothetical protein [Gaiellaceae bacterium]